MPKIIPSILVQTEEEFIEALQSLDGAVDTIQLDIADGEFVPNTTWADAGAVQRLVPSEIKIELHLMVKNPSKELRKWKKVEQVFRVLVHAESVDDLSEIMPKLQTYGWEIGVVLNPDTKVENIKKFLKEITVVMFMGVTPGFQSQPFQKEVLTKIKELVLFRDSQRISIDGAVNTTTLPSLIEAGVDIVCPGSAIFASGSAKKNVQNMQKLINKLKERI